MHEKFLAICMHALYMYDIEALQLDHIITYLFVYCVAPRMKLLKLTSDRKYPTLPADRVVTRGGLSIEGMEQPWRDNKHYCGIR